MNKFWSDAQGAEAHFWGRCINTYGEETKQVEIYAPRMKLTPSYGNYMFDLTGKSVMDIGSGPTSLLLKCSNVEGYAVDPLMDTFPQWVRDRYQLAGITPLARRGEDLTAMTARKPIDEVWIYNVLQHTSDPQRIIENARAIGKLIRIFEWVDIPPDTAHPHVLKAELLDKWLGTPGMTEEIQNTNCYYNVIKL